MPADATAKPRPSRNAPSRTELKAQTRARILDAAINTLIEDGYAGFSMNKIAKRAGIAQPSFYVHFENMDQLFEAMAESVADRFIRPLQEALVSVVQTLKPDEIRGMIYRLFLVGFDIIRDQQALCRMVWAERDQPNSPLGTYLDRFYRDNKQSWGEVLTNIGLVSTSESDRIKLALFMDGVFALFECYATQWMAGRYTEVKDPANALTDYVLFYWQEEMKRLFP